MPFDQNIPRWCYASTSKHFDDRRQGIPLFIEGQIRDTKNLEQFFELRVDGPYLTEVSKGYWRIYGEINVLIQAVQDDKDFHRMQKLAGIIASAFTTIQVFRYGDGVDDDQSFVGCWKLLQSTRGTKERIQVNHFGQIAPDEQLLQSTVEGHYEMFLSM